ncbi:MAG TPA: hypothetical protein VNQ32_00870 [Steroidobacteraceae bacterium]|nr:hypothetical protein [Steroidobacteraceae bacterium]
MLVYERIPVAVRLRGVAVATAATLGWLVAAAPASAQTQSDITHPCDRACLTRFTDTWLEALVANDPSRVPLAPGAKVTLNDDVVGLDKVFWAPAASVQARIDIANPRWGDTGTQAVINNADGSQYLHVFRLKVKNGRITEAEAMTVRNVEEGGLWDPSTLQKPNPNFHMRIRPAEQDSYYDLVAAAEGYWRAFNTNGTPEYHPAEFWPGVVRLENGFRTTDVAVFGGTPKTAAEQFDSGAHAGRNIWDIRYPVVDEEYGVVMSFARFGMKTGVRPQTPAQGSTRLVAEFFAVRKGIIHDIQAVMVNREEALPSAWKPDYGPTRGGWAPIECNRACLTGFIDNYYKALLANDARALPQAARARVTLNGDEMPLARAFYPEAKAVRWRFDAVNERLGDTGSQVVFTNEDGSETMEIVRLKVARGAIAEIEILRCHKGCAGDAWWGPEQLDKEPSDFLKLPIPPAERDSYYQLVAVADGYFRAFQTNGTPDYHRTDLLPDTRRFENGAHFTGTVRNGSYATAASGFDRGQFIGRNLWDRRHAVVDEERGIVLTILRFGKVDGVQNASSVTSYDRIVGEFFNVKSGKIQEVQAVLVNRNDSEPTGWPTSWFGPGKGGWKNLPTGQ